MGMGMGTGGLGPHGFDPGPPWSLSPLAPTPRKLSGAASITCSPRWEGEPTLTESTHL